MANLIGYRVFRQLDPKFSWTFLKVFMIVNFAFAAVLLLIFGLWSL